MIGLDTNVLVRYLTQDDPLQSPRANALIEKAAARGESCAVTSVVLCEVVWVLRSAYGYGKREIVPVLEKLLATVQFVIDDKVSAYAAVEDYRAGRGDFADYLIGRQNRRDGCVKTSTFDRTLGDSDLFEVL
jgi:predicted nucleic-acid-binding protein